MSVPGFVIGLFRLTPTQKPNQLLPFDHHTLGSGGLHDLVHDYLASTSTAGHTSDRHSSWFRVGNLAPQAVGSNPSPLMMEVDGGKFGSHFGRYDVSVGMDLDPVTSDHVLTRQGFLFMSIPAAATIGFIVAEADGVATHIHSVLRYLNLRLKDKSLTLRAQYDLSDAIAWHNYLEDDETWVHGLRMSKPNPNGDGTPLSGDGIYGAKLEVNFTRGSQVQKEIKREAKKSLRTHETSVISIATGDMFEDDDFENTTFVTIRDGKERSLRVNRPSLPRFVYKLDGEERPTDTQLLTQSRDLLATLVNDLGEDLPSGTWPL